MVSARVANPASSSGAWKSGEKSCFPGGNLGRDSTSYVKPFIFNVLRGGLRLATGLRSRAVCSTSLLTPSRFQASNTQGPPPRRAFFLPALPCRPLARPLISTAAAGATSQRKATGPKGCPDRPHQPPCLTPSRNSARRRRQACPAPPVSWWRAHCPWRSARPAAESW